MAEQRLSDSEMIVYIKEQIRSAIIDNDIYYDIDDIETAVETIYPTLFGIVFNSAFDIRRNTEAIDRLAEYLAKQLA